MKAEEGPGWQTALLEGAAKWTPVVVALALAIQSLGRWPLWSAEYYSLQASTLDWSGLVHELALDRHSPLHTALLKLLRIFGSSDPLLRVPSAVGYVGAVALVARTGRARLGPGGGLLAGLVLALSPMAVTYAGVARAYALLMGAGAALLWASLRVREAPRVGVVVLGVAAAAGIYLHYAAVLPILGALLGLSAEALAEGRRGLPRLGAVFLALGLAGVAFAPWALGPLHGQLGQVGWEERHWSVLAYLLWSPVPAAVSWTALLLVLLAAIGVELAVREQRWVLVGWSVAAVLGPWGTSRSVDMFERLFVYIGLLPLFSLLVAMGALRILRWPWLWSIGLGSLQIGLLVSLLQLPSAPLGGSGSGMDNGIFDLRRDARVLVRALPDGAEIAFGEGIQMDHYMRYGARGLIHTGDLRPGTWVASAAERAGPPRGACRIEEAFPFVLDLPDAAACARMMEALAAEPPHGPYLLQLARVEADPERRRALVDEAISRSPADPRPEGLLAELELAAGRPDAALDAVRAGLDISCQWAEAEPAMELLGIQASIHRSLGQEAEALEAEQVIHCLEGRGAPPWGMGACFTPKGRLALLLTLPVEGPGGVPGAGPGRGPERGG